MSDVARRTVRRPLCYDVDPRTVRCPLCYAEAEAACCGIKGNLMSISHVRRIWLACEMAKMAAEAVKS